MDLDITFRADESVLGQWRTSKIYGNLFIVRCHICDTVLVAGYERSMVNEVGLDATEEWVEHMTKHKWNEGSPCKHIIFDMLVGVSLQDIWMEWAGRGTTTGSSQKPLI